MAQWHPDDPSPVDQTSRELDQIKFALDQAAIVAITDVRGRITYANDQFCRISGYRRDELMGRDHRLVNSGFHGSEFIRDLWQTIARGQVWRGEIRNRAKDGSIYWVDTTIVPFVNEAGRPWQYLAIRHDITERKRQEDRLRDQAALTALGQLAAVVAHEVRNPLAGIRGGVQVLGTLSQDREAGDLVREIVARIDSLNSLVEDLLIYARQRELRRSAVDVTTFVSDLLGSLRQDPAFGRITLTTALAEGLVVHADLDQLRVIFGNILLNAAQALAGGGAIEIAAREDDDGAVILTVTDDGPGVPESARSRVFEPFFTTKSRGTGLGLPTARRFVEAHAGTIDLLDRPGGGTIVRTAFPRPLSTTVV